MQDPNIEENTYDYVLIIESRKDDDSIMHKQDYSKYKKHKLSKREAHDLNHAYALNHISKRYIKI